MKINSISIKRIAAFILALVMSLSLAACGSNADVTLDDIGIGDEITAPAPEGIISDYWADNDKDDNDSDKDDNDDSSTAGEAKESKAMSKSTLKGYGTIETLVKSVSKPTADNSKNISDSNYGTIDYSMAAQGYIEFTAKGQMRILILEGPNDSQAMIDCSKNETIKVALTDGAGKYQYAICNDDGEYVIVMYKNSFTVSVIDSELAPYLVSTPYGDYENAPNAVKQADELWDVKKTQLENIKTIAKWVKDNIDYDKTGKFGTLDVYVDPDKVIENGKGVCNEMSKLLAAMLRSQGIPAYAQGGKAPNGEEHLWVMAWVELSSETENGTTSSTGAWVLVEATSGTVKLNSQAAKYTPDSYKG